MIPSASLYEFVERLDRLSMWKRKQCVRENHRKIQASHHQFYFYSPFRFHRH